MSPLWLAFTAQLPPFPTEVKSTRFHLHQFHQHVETSSASGAVRAEAYLITPGSETTSGTNC